MRRMRVVLNAKAGTVNDMGPDKVGAIVDEALRGRTLMSMSWWRKATP